MSSGRLAQRRAPRSSTTLSRYSRSCAEPAGGDLGVEVAVGRGDDADVDAPRSGSRRRARTRASSSTRSSLACSAGDISPISSRNSVPPLGASTRPAWSRDRAGERAARVAEQLALEQVLGQRGAVDGDERRRGARDCWRGRRARARSLPVPLSPRSRIGASELAARSASCNRRAHLGRLAGDLGAGAGRGELGLEVRDAVLGPALARDPLDDVADLAGVERLGQVIERAPLDRLDGGVERRVRGDHRRPRARGARRAAAAARPCHRRCRAGDRGSRRRTRRARRRRARPPRSTPW